MKKIYVIILGCLIAISAIAIEIVPTMVVTLKDGSKQEFSISDIDEITFITDDESEQTGDIDIDITQLTVSSVKATFKATDPAQTFLFGLVTKEKFDEIGGDSEFLDYEISRLTEEADEWWFDSLADYLDFLLSDWNPDDQKLNRDNLSVDTDYYLYAYGINVSGELTTGLFKKPVHTPGYMEVDFKLKATDITSSTVTLTAAPDNQTIYYYLGFITKSEFENEFNCDEEYVVSNALASIRMAIGNDGTKLGEVASVHKGNGTQKLTHLTPDMEYYALAFGIDESVSASTVLTKIPFKTSPVEITDHCTFDVTVASVEPMFIDLNVKPSDPSTRYFVAIRKTADTASLTPTQVADNEIAFQNGFQPPIDWSTDPRVFTGDRTLNSRKNLGVTIIMPSTEYTVYVFGVSEQGVRTTDVSTLKVTTPAPEASSMTLTISGISAGAESDPDDWTGWGNKICYFTYSVDPSVNNQYYYTGVVRKSDYEKFSSDSDFMAEVIRTAGETVMMNCYMGRDNSVLNPYPVPFKTTADYAGASIVNGQEYYVFAFGYAGIAITPLFKEEVKADDGSGSSGGGDWGWGDFE
ncbi:MAG: hypothetical protein K2K98_12505 [Muribaculaceae bacterium]|nr:hypothetical protein [Muribaculaceae bacterium]